MKANEFVKKFGWYGAISFTDWYGGNTAFKFLKVKEKTISVHSGDQPYDFHINDLKRLVESHELVEKLGGLNKSKKVAKKSYDSCSSIISDRTTGFECKWVELNKAIKDVESCQ